MNLDPDDGEIIEVEPVRRDRRSITAGSVITAHHSAESFMRATGAAEVQLPRIPARDAHRAMLAAWEEKYGAAR